MLPRLLLPFFLLVSLLSYGQSDTLKGPSKLQQRKQHVTRATLLSAALPGAGQYYNWRKDRAFRRTMHAKDSEFRKHSYKWVKIPVLYTAAGFLGYGIYNQNKDYQRYRQALFLKQTGATDQQISESFTPENGSGLGGFPQSYLTTRRDQARRDRDWFIILASLLYVANLIDANVDAHLQGFYISQDLIMSVNPVPMGNDAFGMEVSLRF